MKPITWLAPILLCAAAGAFAAAPKPAPSSAAAPKAAPAAAPAPTDPPIRKLDGVLVDIKGRGLYTYDGDTVSGKSGIL